MVEREKLVAMVQGVQNGDGEAMAQMYETFRDDFYYFILKTVKNDRELAEDLTQDTFVDIMEKVHMLEEPAAFVTWAKQLAYRKCTDYFKKRKELLLDENEDGSTMLDTLVEEDTEFIPDEALDDKELKQTILNMINGLPEEQRAAILLRYFNEVSVKEIAQIQSVSEGTVKSRLNYARKSIKQSVEAYEKKNGIKLHCAGVIPMLLWLFRQYRTANKLSLTTGLASQAFTAVPGSAATASAVVGAEAVSGTETAVNSTVTVTAGNTTAVSNAVVDTAVKTTAKVGVKAAAKAVSTKVIAGVLAATVTVGGVAVGIGVSSKKTQEGPAASVTQQETVREDDVIPTVTEVLTETENKNTEETAERVPVVTKYMTFYLPKDQLGEPLTDSDANIFGYELNNGITITAQYEPWSELFTTTYEYAQFFAGGWENSPIETRDGIYYFSTINDGYIVENVADIFAFIEGPDGCLVVTSYGDADILTQLQEEIWNYIVTGTPFWELPVDNQSTAGLSGDVREAYKEVLRVYESAHSPDEVANGVPHDLAYTLYDIDKDGTPELIVTEYGERLVYRMQDDVAILCGSAYGYWGLWACEDNGLIVHDGGIGQTRIETMSKFTMPDFALEYAGEMVSTGDDTWEEFEQWQKKYTQINDYCPVNDYSLLGRG